MKDFKLGEKAKQGPYQAPEHYFTRLPSRLQQRLSHTSGQIAIAWYLRKRWQTAFVLLLLLATGLWVHQPQPSPQAEVLLEALSDEAIADYLEADLLNSVSMADFSAVSLGNDTNDLLQTLDEESLYQELEDDVSLLTPEELSL